MQNIVSALGANPIMVPALDTYLSLSRGMADGVVASSATLVSWKIGEVTKCHTRVTLTGNLFWCGMNKERWESLSDEHKKILTETSAKMSEKCCTVTDEAAKAEIKWCADQGHEIIMLSDEELARWQKQLAPMYDTWLADMAKLGIKEAPAILEDAKAFTKKRFDELVAAGTF
jgi:C4-dicarboxylate-binding protein DctP